MAESTHGATASITGAQDISGTDQVLMGNHPNNNRILVGVPAQVCRRYNLLQDTHRLVGKAYVRLSQYGLPNAAHVLTA